MIWVWCPRSAKACQCFMRARCWKTRPCAISSQPLATPTPAPCWPRPRNTPTPIGCPMSALYQIENLRLSLADMTRKPLLGAAPRLEILKGLNFTIPKGEILGIVGGSGSGKSTLGRALVRLLDPSGGQVRFDGIDITHMAEPDLRALRRRFQMIFQDPMSSLNPRHRVGQIIAAPLSLHGLDNTHARALEALDHVGLPRSFARRFPHEL